MLPASEIPQIFMSNDSAPGAAPTARGSAVLSRTQLPPLPEGTVGLALASLEGAWQSRKARGHLHPGYNDHVNPGWGGGRDGMELG